MFSLFDFLAGESVEDNKDALEQSNSRVWLQVDLKDCFVKIGPSNACHTLTKPLDLRANALPTPPKPPFWPAEQLTSLRSSRPL